MPDEKERKQEKVILEQLVLSLQLHKNITVKFPWSTMPFINDNLLKQKQTRQRLLLKVFPQIWIYLVKKKSANMRISSSQTHDNVTSTFYRKDNYCKISLQQIQKRKKITFLMELMCCFSVSALFFNSSFMLSFSEQIPRISSWCLLFSSSNLSKKVQIDFKHLKSFKNLGALHLGRVNRVSTNVRKSNLRLFKTLFVPPWIKFKTEKLDDSAVLQSNTA